MSIDNKNLRLEVLDSLTSQQLDELLHTELEREQKDSERVLQILHILEEREAGDPNNAVGVDDVWGAYQEYMLKGDCLLEKLTRKDKKANWWTKGLAAVVAIVCILLFATPKVMGSENIFEILGRWTQTVFEFFKPMDSTEAPEEYIFKTNHPGLQQIYDTVVEQGVTQPVVPSWVPEGFALDEIKVTKAPMCKKIYAGLYNGDKAITIAFEIYGENRSNQYTKNQDNVFVYEKEGINHYIMSNEDSWQSVWTADNIECMVLMDCEKEIAYKIITSIYEEIE